MFQYNKRHFSNNNNDGYQSDSENDKEQFESDRRFSNFVLSVGAFALAGAFMYSNVLHATK